VSIKKRAAAYIAGIAALPTLIALQKPELSEAIFLYPVCMVSGGGAVFLLEQLDKERYIKSFKATSMIPFRLNQPGLTTVGMKNTNGLRMYVSVLSQREVPTDVKSLMPEEASNDFCEVSFPESSEKFTAERLLKEHIEGSYRPFSWPKASTGTIFPIQPPSNMNKQPHFLWQNF